MAEAKTVQPSSKRPPEPPASSASWLAAPGPVARGIDRPHGRDSREGNNILGPGGMLDEELVCFVEENQSTFNLQKDREDGAP